MTWIEHPSLFCPSRLRQRGTIRSNNASAFSGSRRRNSRTAFKAAVRAHESEDGVWKVRRLKDQAIEEDRLLIAAIKRQEQLSQLPLFS